VITWECSYGRLGGATERVKRMGFGPIQCLFEYCGPSKEYGVPRTKRGHVE
jgi:hypothetical protein